MDQEPVAPVDETDLAPHQLGVHEGAGGVGNEEIARGRPGRPQRGLQRGIHRLLTQG